MFSDWYNTNDVTIQMADGTSVSAHIRHQTRDAVDIQVCHADGSLAAVVQRVARADIASIEPVPSLTMTIHEVKWHLAGAMGIAVLLMIWRWFTRKEVKEWMNATWEFGKMIVPLLFGGVFLTGFVGALLPEEHVAGLVGGNGLAANLVASVAGCLWYFATLTEIPITQVLMQLGMGKGPALALLLAGPVLSLPSIVVLVPVMGAKKTAMFTALVVIMSTLVGWVFGAIAW
jgi:uncharacterized membrane protein YraQ (UPF0718 family)